MDRISGLSDELLVRILSFLPTKDAVSTSILSKQWEFLWMWLPKLEYNDYRHANPPDTSAFRYLDFIDKNLPLHKAPVLETLVLKSCNPELFRPENIESWVGTAVSRCVRELTVSIRYNSTDNKPFVPLPNSFYTCCNFLAALKLKGESIFVDVPQTVNLPSLKTLKLRDVSYSNDDSLRLLLSSCPVLEDLFIQRYGEGDDDNVRAVVVKNSTLQRLTLKMYSDHRSEQHVIVTPSLKYLKIFDAGTPLSYMIEHMPKLEEADIDVLYSLDEILGSMTSVKHLSLRQFFNREDESVFSVDAVFNELEHLKLRIYSEDWSRLLVWLLRNSPKLRELNLSVDSNTKFPYYAPVEWEKRSSVPGCFQNTLETFKFEGFTGTQEECDFSSFFFKNARFLKSASITNRVTQEGCRY